MTSFLINKRTAISFPCCDNLVVALLGCTTDDTGLLGLDCYH